MFGIISVLEDLCPRFNCLALDLRGSWRIWRGSLSLLFHHFVSCTSTTGSKTAQKYDSTTTMLDNWYSVLWKPHIYSSNQKAQSFLLKAFGLCGQPSRAWRWWFWSRGFFLGWHPLITPWASVAPGLFLNNQTSFLSSEDGSPGLLPDLGKVETWAPQFQQLFNYHIYSRLI